MKLKKLAALICCIFMFNIPVYAAIPNANSVSAAFNDLISSPNSDIIIWKYATINGVEYKRRWNSTKNCWVDSEWIPA